MVERLISINVIAARFLNAFTIICGAASFVMDSEDKEIEVILEIVREHFVKISELANFSDLLIKDRTALLYTLSMHFVAD